MKLAILIAVLAALFALPTLAQDEAANEVEWNQFGFVVDPAFAQNVNISRYPGDPPEQGPGFSDAPHTQITLYNELGLPESVFKSQGLIRLYRVEDLAPYRFLAMEADTLYWLLQERPDLELFNAVDEDGTMADPLPYIPVLPHGQILRARAHYVETDAVDGIAYITYSNATPEPFLATHFTYTFQGLSADGQYYISASFPLFTELFPTEPQPIEPDEFFAEWPEYLRATIDLLNDAEQEALRPAPATVDSLIETFTFAAE